LWQGGWTRDLFGRFFRARQARDEAKELAHRVHSAAQVLGLESALARRPDQLSGGQQQRVALGRALVRRPQLLLLDEPLSNLDAALRLELRRELHLLHRHFPATMVYVTHDPVEALALGDRVAVLRAGRLEQVDRPAALLERPVNRFVAGFVGWPPMSFVDGRLFGKEGVTLGIRPEYVTWHGEPGPDRMPMQVARVEALGSGLLVTFSASGQQVTGLAIANGHLTVEEGQKVMVSIAANHVHLFDSTTGLALRSSTG
jgi:ABC-type sugar transport system ATPase subunit